MRHIIIHRIFIGSETTISFVYALYQDFRSAICGVYQDFSSAIFGVFIIKLSIKRSFKESLRPNIELPGSARVTLS